MSLFFDEWIKFLPRGNNRIFRIFYGLLNPSKQGSFPYLCRPYEWEKTNSYERDPAYRISSPWQLFWRCTKLRADAG
jgi:hypothetical protein